MSLSMSRWFGKVAIVTGASSGIGSAIARKLVEQGIKTVGVAPRVELIEELSKTLKDEKGTLYAQEADMTKEEDVLRVFDWTTKNLGPVHILVNNAGTFDLSASLSEGSTDRWRRVMDLNVLGLCIASREAFKIMKTNNIDGHIINVNSIGGHGVVPKMNIYSASKYAVTALTETFRREMIQHQIKIKITSLSPGMVETELTTQRKEIAPEVSKSYEGMPFLKPEDVAEAVNYILSTPEHVQVKELILIPTGERINCVR